MHTDSDTTPALQFDTATYDAGESVAAQGSGGVACVSCDRSITGEYYDVNGQAVCEPCRDSLDDLARTPKGWGPLARAAGLGIAAAVLGAILYYAVIAITKFEIGLVAIAIGYMVGYAIRLGTRGRGGRRFQILAVVLTYWAVGLAYVPFAVRGASEPRQAAAARNAPAPAGAEEAAPSPRPPAIVILGLIVAFSLALPVLVVVASMPGGLISAAIIVFGMMQAWRMTGSPHLAISGPFQIGPAGSSRS